MRWGRNHFSQPETKPVIGYVVRYVNFRYGVLHHVILRGIERRAGGKRPPSGWM